MTAIKALLFIFDYEKFQKWIAGMLAENEGKKIVLVDIIAVVFSAVVVVASLLVY